MYISGVFGECETDFEQVAIARDSCFLLYECGGFNALVELLNMEAE